MPEPKFFADDMVGRLCWWLRMIGYDTAYQREIDDDELAARARREGRVVLTRDTSFASRYPDVRVFYLKTDRAEEQVWRVLREFHLEFDHDWFSRCLVCNTPLMAVPKEKYRSRIPPYVYRTLDEFWYCRTCDQLFWRGTHHQNMVKKLGRLRKELDMLEQAYKKQQESSRAQPGVEGIPDAVPQDRESQRKNK